MKEYPLTVYFQKPSGFFQKIFCFLTRSEFYTVFISVSSSCFVEGGLFGVRSFDSVEFYSRCVSDSFAPSGCIRSVNPVTLSCLSLSDSRFTPWDLCRYILLSCGFKSLPSFGCKVGEVYDWFCQLSGSGSWRHTSK